MTRFRSRRPALAAMLAAALSCTSAPTDYDASVHSSSVPRPSSPSASAIPSPTVSFPVQAHSSSPSPNCRTAHVDAHDYAICDEEVQVLGGSLRVSARVGDFRWLYEATRECDVRISEEEMWIYRADGSVFHIGDRAPTGSGPDQIDVQTADDHVSFVRGSEHHGRWWQGQMAGPFDEELARQYIPMGQRQYRIMRESLEIERRLASMPATPAADIEELLEDVPSEDSFSYQASPQPHLEAVRGEGESLRRYIFWPVSIMQKDTLDIIASDGSVLLEMDSETDEGTTEASLADKNRSITCTRVAPSDTHHRAREWACSDRTAYPRERALSMCRTGDTIIGVLRGRYGALHGDD